MPETVKILIDMNSVVESQAGANFMYWRVADMGSLYWQR